MAAGWGPYALQIRTRTTGNCSIASCHRSVLRFVSTSYIGTSAGSSQRIGTVTFVGDDIPCTRPVASRRGTRHVATAMVAGTAGARVRQRGLEGCFVQIPGGGVFDGECYALDQIRHGSRAARRISNGSRVRRRAVWLRCAGCLPTAGLARCGKAIRTGSVVLTMGIGSYTLLGGFVAAIVAVLGRSPTAGLASCGNASRTGSVGRTIGMGSPTAGLARCGSASRTGSVARTIGMG